MCLLIGAPFLLLFDLKHELLSLESMYEQSIDTTKKIIADKLTIYKQTMLKLALTVILVALTTSN